MAAEFEEFLVVEGGGGHDGTLIWDTNAGKCGMAGVEEIGTIFSRWWIFAVTLGAQILREQVP
jgi:hypothetical protein